MTDDTRHLLLLTLLISLFVIPEMGTDSHKNKQWGWKGGEPGLAHFPNAKFLQSSHLIPLSVSSSNGNKQKKRKKTE